MVESSYKRAIKILTENKEGLEKLANKLLEKEVIFSDDLEEVFGEKKSICQKEIKQNDNSEKIEKSSNNEK